MRATLKRTQAKWGGKLLSPISQILFVTVYCCCAKNICCWLLRRKENRKQTMLPDKDGRQADWQAVSSSRSRSEKNGQQNNKAAEYCKQKLIRNVNIDDIRISILLEFITRILFFVELTSTVLFSGCCTLHYLCAWRG